MFAVTHTLACLILCSALAAVEWPTVPDPIGLGPRLALLDWLSEHQVKAPAGASDEVLVGLYYDAAAGLAAASSADPAVRVSWVGDREWQAVDAWTKPSGKTSFDLGATARWRGDELVVTVPDSSWQVRLGDGVSGGALPMTSIDGRLSVVLGADLSRPLFINARRGGFQRTWQVQRRTP